MRALIKVHVFSMTRARACVLLFLLGLIFEIGTFIWRVGLSSSVLTRAQSLHESFNFRVRVGRLRVLGGKTTLVILALINKVRARWAPLVFYILSSCLWPNYIFKPYYASLRDCDPLPSYGKAFFSHKLIKFHFVLGIWFHVTHLFSSWSKCEMRMMVKTICIFKNRIFPSSKCFN